MRQIQYFFAIVSLGIFFGCSAAKLGGTGGKSGKEGGGEVRPGPTSAGPKKTEVNCTDLTRVQCQSKIDELKKSDPTIDPVPYRDVRCPTATKEDPKCEAEKKKQQDLDGGMGSELRVKNCADDPTIAGCVLDGGGGTLLDFKACVSPNGGNLQPNNYGRCKANQALIIVNDGTGAEQMTCCPLTVTDLFSTNPAELGVARDSCGPDEVSVGMRYEGGRYRTYCSKINAAVYAVKSTSTAILAKNYATGLDPNLKTLVSNYGYGDCCVCKNGIMSGGSNHSRSNETCTETCVEITKK